MSAALVLHGLAGTPFEVAVLAESLRRVGVFVDTPLLPGHGTCLDDFKKTFYPDWRAYALERFADLQKHYETVVVAGFSMGGALALDIASSHNVAGVITLAAPHSVYRLYPPRFRDWRIPLLGLLQYVHPYPKYRVARPQSRAIAPFEGYEGVLCLPQLHSMVKGFAQMRQRLHAVTCPALLVHDLHDKLVHPAYALEIAQAIASCDVTLHYTCIQETVTSHHMLGTHRETRALVAKLTTQFAERVLALQKNS